MHLNKKKIVGEEVGRISLKGNYKWKIQEKLAKICPIWMRAFINPTRSTVSDTMQPKAAFISIISAPKTNNPQRKLTMLKWKVKYTESPFSTLSTTHSKVSTIRRRKNNRRNWKRKPLITTIDLISTILVMLCLFYQATPVLLDQFQ